MYDVAETIQAWQDEGRPVVLARVVQTRGMSSSWPNQTVAFGGVSVSGGLSVGDGGGGSDVAGTLLAGAADEELAALAEKVADSGAAQVATVHVGDREAIAAGLACGGQADVLVQLADDIPAEAWSRFQERRPLSLISEVSGVHAGRTRLADTTPSGLGANGSALDLDAEPHILTADFWPAPQVLIVGEGLLANALRTQCRLLGWTPAVLNTATAAIGAAAALQQGDGLVVLSHDPDIDATVLASALAADVGYIGALGSRSTQARRAAWLAEHGASDEQRKRVHGPAGLDIGAHEPAEIAVAIIAEMLAVRSGGTGVPLSVRGGPIHRDHAADHGAADHGAADHGAADHAPESG